MKSKYLGVYRNNYAPSRDEFPWRAALKRYVNSKPEYTNIGYTRTEESAGCLYNIFALSTFGKGAIINDIDMTEEIEEEMNELIEHIDGFSEVIERSIAVLEEFGPDISTAWCTHTCSGRNNFYN